MRLEIDEAYPSINRVLWRHWSKQVQQKKRWAWLIRRALLKIERPASPICPAKVTVTRYGRRRLDFDNLVAGAKSTILDRLKDEKIILDDAPEHVSVVYLQRTPAIPKTVIEIQAVE